MEIKRDRYLQQIIDYLWDGQVKVITGIRRCGKSYLLNVLFKNYLREQGIPDEQIISIQLDLTKDIRYRNPLELADALNDLRSLPNLDVYVTGSNSKMLSKDILTEFRGRSDEIRVHPLSFAEFYSAVSGDKEDAFESYAFYGGMPLVLSRPNDTAKANYLSSLFSEVYIKDIVERKKIEREDILGQLLDLLCSSVGSLTNPKKIADTLRSKTGEDFSQNTVSNYIDIWKTHFFSVKASALT